MNRPPPEDFHAVQRAFAAHLRDPQAHAAPEGMEDATGFRELPTPVDADGTEKQKACFPTAAVTR